MNIEIQCQGSKCIAKVVENNSVIFISKEHPRAGCATREAMLYLQQVLGKPTQEVKLELLEWK